MVEESFKEPLVVGVFGVHGVGKSKIANALRSRFETLDYRVGFVEEQASALKKSGQVEINQATTVESQFKILHAGERRLIEELRGGAEHYSPDEDTRGSYVPHVVILDRLWICNHAYLEKAVETIVGKINSGLELTGQEIEDLKTFGSAYPERAPFTEKSALAIINRMGKQKAAKPEKEYLNAWYNTKMDESIHLWVVQKQAELVTLALKAGFFPIDSNLMKSVMQNGTRALEPEFRLAIAEKIEGYSTRLKTLHPEFRLRELESPYKLRACETKAELRYSIAAVVAQAESVAMTEIWDLLKMNGH
jgi:hypothetical protein